MLFLTLSLGDDGEQIAAVLPGREEVSVAVLSSWKDSGETGHISLSEADSLDDSIASKAEERRPVWRTARKDKRLNKCILAEFEIPCDTCVIFKMLKCGDKMHRCTEFIK